MQQLIFDGFTRPTIDQPTGRPLPPSTLSLEQALTMVRVVGRSFWTFGQTNMSTGGLQGQLTHCIYQDRIPFYVRENVNGIPSFLISSSERWGDKTGKRPRKERMVLELCAPPKFWQAIAEVVHLTDTLKRPVLPNGRFNKKFIREHFDMGWY